MTTRLYAHVRGAGRSVTIRDTAATEQPEFVIVLPSCTMTEVNDRLHDHGWTIDRNAEGERWTEVDLGHFVAAVHPQESE